MVNSALLYTKELTRVCKHTRRYNMSWKDVALMMESRVEQLQDRNSELVKQIDSLRGILEVILDYTDNDWDAHVNNLVRKALEETC